MRAEYERRRALLLERLDGAAGARLTKPEGGFFALLEVRSLGRPSEEIRRRLLEDHGVIVVHGSAYGPPGEGTLRISFAAGGETLEAGLARLREGLERLAG
jgi:aspartate/methionine/tyrosine aminotransferase